MASFKFASLDSSTSLTGGHESESDSDSLFDGSDTGTGSDSEGRLSGSSYHKNPEKQRASTPSSPSIALEPDETGSSGHFDHQFPEFQVRATASYQTGPYGNVGPNLVLNYHTHL
jgi:hypothetical protein